jgi:two-component system sensor histidine kinase TorS
VLLSSSKTTPQTLSQHYRVLIVEDNEINLDVACALVEKLGHSVTAAKDGASALKSMHNKQFDLALLDINLPDIDGVTLSQQLKAIAQEKQIAFKTIAVSAHVFNEDITKFIESGFDGFVSKPVQMKKLKPSIAKVMFNVEGIIVDENSTIVSSKEKITETVLFEEESDERCHLAQLEDSLAGFHLFDEEIPNQDIEYLGIEKVKQLSQLFCLQIDSEYNELSNLSAAEQQAKLHKFKGAAIGLGLVKLYQLCQQHEFNLNGKKLNENQLLKITELAQLSKAALESYANNLGAH